MSATSLPIDAHLPAIRTALRRDRALVLTAEPGAGKTTRVPPALLDVFDGEVLVIEPRRLAARLAARRVAEELGEKVGERVGYRVRDDKKVSSATRLSFVTDGVFMRRLIQDPELRGTSVVIIDEFHERRIQSDLALAFAARLRGLRRDPLAVVVMSATLQAEPVAAFLEADILSVSGRVFPVDVSYSDPSREPLEKRVRRACAELGTHSGDVLVFLPGAREIRRCAEEAATLADRQGRDIHVLHGDLKGPAQDRAVRPGPKPKFIFSTNVAESSVTIPGVTAVVDSGLAR
ncbi:MAG: DEAD/DEAH box helicase, partial [Myxococcota bacterium]